MTIKNRLFGARADVRTSPALPALAGEHSKNGVGGDCSEMPQHQVMEMLVELGAFQYLHADGTKLEKAVQRFN